jgi:DNA invertase Pin-like site-specific DNA recombinase
MNIGYARVSTYEQNLDMQIDALKLAGCDPIYSDKVSGIKEHRPNWERTFEYARKGDTIIVWRLDRIGRGHTDLLRIVEELEKKEVHLKTLTGIQVDTSTPTGRLFFRVATAFIEYDRDQIVERTKAGLAAARARGRFGGRRSLLVDPRRVKMFKELVEARNEDNKLKFSVEEIRQMMSLGKGKPISKTTYFRWMKLIKGEEIDKQKVEE